MTSKMKFILMQQLASLVGSAFVVWLLHLAAEYTDYTLVECAVIYFVFLTGSQMAKGKRYG